MNLSISDGKSYVMNKAFDLLLLTGEPLSLTVLKDYPCESLGPTKEPNLTGEEPTLSTSSVDRDTEPCESFLLEEKKETL